MKNNFDLKKFLVENKLTKNSKLLSENTDLPELRKHVESKLSGKHDEHLVDSVLHDCFESAEVLMDEQPGTTAADALFSVAENWEENYYDEGRDEEEAIAKDIVSVVEPLSYQLSEKVDSKTPDATKDLKASDAFKAVGIDMNEPVLVLTQDGGHGEQETKGTVSAQEALKMFQQLRAKGMEDDKQDYYEFENEINFSAEGYEYKIAYFEEESTTTALMQKSGVNEIDADLLKRAQNTPAPKDGSARLAKRKASLDNEKAGTLQVSKGPNAEQEQRVIDIARDAIALMDEQPGTSAKDALNSVLGL